MRIRHVALACSSEERADAFYRDLLGLNKGPSKMLPDVLSNALFSIDAALRIVYYIGDSLELEIFIIEGDINRPASIDHLCLEVEDLSAFLEKCHSRNIQCLRVPKGDGLITFISDADGNRFEIIEIKGSGLNI